MEAMERKTLLTDLGLISYLERKNSAGSSGSIVFLHGLGGTGNAWIRVASLMRDDIDVYMPDLLGHGRSDKSKGNYTLNDQVSAVDSFIKLLQLDDFTLVGNSYGGWISLKYFLRFGRPSILVLVDSAGINPTVAETSPEAVESFIDDAVKMSPFNEPRIIRNLLNNNSKPSEKVTVSDLDRIKAKTIIIWGSKDNIIPLKYGKILHERIKGSRMFILDGEGHTPHITSPGDIAEILNGLFPPFL